MAVEKLVSEKLGNLEEVFLLGNRLYNRSTTTTKSDLQKKIMPNMQVKIVTEKNELEIGENLHVRIELINRATAPLLVARVEDAIPVGFELIAVSSGCSYVSNYLDAHGLKIEPHIAENIEINLRSTKTGAFLVAPKILCTSGLGLQMTFKPEPVSVIVRKTILPDRIRTGFQDLDNLLFGGIPENYAVLLMSASCDERDLLIKRYMETSVIENCLTFYVTIDPVSAQSLADEFTNTLYALVCNPHGQVSENHPNVFKANGVENLTEVNITLESILRIFDNMNLHKGRACLEIISDVLLQHRAVRTRKWLSGLIPELRSRGFTTLAVLNPFMHSSEELHSIVDLFDGEIDIRDREPKNGYTKYLRIRRMHNERYLDSELPLKRTRLMATPVRLSCCSRAPNV
jgi:KaiC/GvpD/RAD55 family RecA-like ATPase